MPTNITELPYFENSCIYFEQLRDLPWAVFLDSCHPNSDKGRYDILSASPITHLETYQEQTQVTTRGKVTLSQEDPFSLLKTLLAQYPRQPSTLPFNGGVLGYFAYDLNKRVETLPDTVVHDITLPQMAVGIYLWAVIVDHVLKKTYLLNPPNHALPDDWEMIKHRLLTLEKTPSQESFYLTSPLTSNLTAAQYQEQFTHIMQHIHQGDVYQINFAQRWQANTQGDPWSFYRILRKHNPAPFAAYLQHPKGAILSCSPERFLTAQEGKITTMPIKGTIARRADPIEDKAAADFLLNSEKNRAENIMIVDLMRNDLGKSCEIGSVNVPECCALQSFTNVHHLVSTVQGQLRKDKHNLDVLRDCFPGGSITGAPKIRAMELIDQYERHQRHIYCGAIGYIDVNGRMDTNIAIRTAVVCDDTLYFWGGGGIVADSIAEAEYQETIDKVKPFLAACSHLIL
jgi:para-aminobenzoate synthetase component I